MLRLLLVLSLACSPVLAQSDAPQPTPRRSTQPPRRVSAAASVPERNRENLTNYRIVLKVEPKGQPVQQLSLVMVEGSAELNAIDSNPTQIDGSSTPSTVNLSVNLKEIEESRCEIRLVLGRTVPYVAGVASGPGGQTRSMVQQISVGMNTTLILSPGQSIVAQETDAEKITVTLTRLE